MGATQTRFLNRQLANVPGEIPPNKMKQLQKQVLFEYPFLAHVFESVLICDNQQPDCPIVYCNDLFEQMTLYPKEEIIGRNCRFLQGGASNQKIVKLIRQAVIEGLELDVEILNYRKDGVPFFNNFLMLPVHAPKKRTGEVQYFIAIQKDVTVLRQPGSNPKNWSVEEVAMWLYHIGFVEYSTKFLNQGITGAKLLELSTEAVEALTNQKDSVAITQKIRQISQDPTSTFSSVSIPKEIHYSAPRGASEDDIKDVANVGKGVSLNSRQWWRQFSESDKTSTDECEKASSNPNIINASTSPARLTIKLYYKNNIKVIHLMTGSSFAVLKSTLDSLYKANVRLKYLDFDKEWITMNDEDSWESAKFCADVGTLSVRVSKRKAKKLSSSGKVADQPDKDHSL